jgi:hypothetical protein
MIAFEEAKIAGLILHRATGDETTSVISETLFEQGDDEEVQLLKKVLLKPFETHSYTFEFTHPVDLEFNVLFNLMKNIYEGGDLANGSADILKHLIASSSHHNIKEGDLFIAQFEDIQLDQKHYQAIGIYKYEDKDSFIETSFRNKKADMSVKKGIGTKKPDKACLVIFTEQPYTILVIDNNNGDTAYWQEEFIQHKAKNDHVNSTNNFLTITRDFITGQIRSEFDITKTDQMDLLNRSVEYFKTHEQFDKQDFEKEVFYHDNIIESFRKFDESYRSQHEVEVSDQFEISRLAVKKQAKIFKSVLKLDKNFHIYIHGGREFIEQGIDERGRKFYKIYYNEET